jgi:hypothetical protein
MSADPEQDIGHLHELLRHPGFALLCKRFEESRDKLRDNCMSETNDIEASKLRRAHENVKEMHPKAECELLITHAKRAIKKETPSTDGR